MNRAQTAMQANGKLLGQPNTLRWAMLTLSLSGCNVLRFTSGAEMPSVQLDRAPPREGDFRELQFQRTQHGDRVFESTEWAGCRLYWLADLTNADPPPPATRAHLASQEVL